MIKDEKVGVEVMLVHLQQEKEVFFSGGRQKTQRCENYVRCGGDKKHVGACVCSIRNDTTEE